MARFFSWIHEKYTQKIQVRLTILFLLILMPLVVLSLIVNFYFQNVLLQRTVERTETALASSMDFIEVTLRNLEDISVLQVTDQNLQAKLNKIGPELDATSYILFSEMMKDLSKLLPINHMIKHVSIYHAPSGMLMTTMHGGKRIVNEEQARQFQKLPQEHGTKVIYMMPDFEMSDGVTFGKLLNTDSVSLVRTMNLDDPDGDPNLLVFSIVKENLLDLIRSLLPSSSAEIYLMNENQEFIVGTTGTGANIDLVQNTPGMVAVKVDSERYKWSLLLLQPEREIYGELKLPRIFTYIIIGVSIILALLISWGVFSGIANPIQRLLKGMNIVGSGNFNVRLENNRNDELGYLTRTFNKMVEDQKHLIEHHYEQQLQLANTELKFLQSQINPHFLYNTLDSIYQAAKNYEADEISEMVLHLSRFFRLSLSKGQDSFTVEETVMHLHYYIRVQQLRFLDSFTVTYDVAPESKSIYILKLLLQPLVENAILHGLENKDGGELIISSRVEDGFLVIQVKDNGRGIAAERLDTIKEVIERIRVSRLGEFSYMGPNDQAIYGLRNVFSRLKMVYGDRAKLLIESELDKGTLVTLQIPVDRCVSEITIRNLSVEGTASESDDS